MEGVRHSAPGTHTHTERTTDNNTDTDAGTGRDTGSAANVGAATDMATARKTDTGTGAGTDTDLSSANTGVLYTALCTHSQQGLACALACACMRAYTRVPCSTLARRASARMRFRSLGNFVLQRSSGSGGVREVGAEGLRVDARAAGRLAGDARRWAHRKQSPYCR